MSDDESTHQIDLDALRASLATRQAQGSTPEAPTSDRETSRALDPEQLQRQFEHDDETVMAPPSPANLRRSARHADSEGTAVTRLDPAIMAKLRASFSDPREHLADLDDVEEAPASIESSPNSGATQSWQVAPRDLLDEGDTQTGLPEGAAFPIPDDDPPAWTQEEEALPDRKSVV